MHPSTDVAEPVFFVLGLDGSHGDIGPPTRIAGLRNIGISPTRSYTGRPAKNHAKSTSERTATLAISVQRHLLSSQATFYEAKLISWGEMVI